MLRLLVATLVCLFLCPCDVADARAARPAASRRAWRKQCRRPQRCAPICPAPGDPMFCAMELWYYDPMTDTGLFRLSLCIDPTCDPGDTYWDWLDASDTICPDDCLDVCETPPVTRFKFDYRDPPDAWSRLSETDYVDEIGARLPTWVKTRSDALSSPTSAVPVWWDPASAVRSRDHIPCQVELKDPHGPTVTIGAVLVKAHVDLNYTWAQRRVHGYSWLWTSRDITVGFERELATPNPSALTLRDGDVRKVDDYFVEVKYLGECYIIPTKTPVPGPVREDSLCSRRFCSP